MGHECELLTLHKRKLGPRRIERLAKVTEIRSPSAPPQGSLGASYLLVGQPSTREGCGRRKDGAIDPPE